MGMFDKFKGAQEAMQQAQQYAAGNGGMAGMGTMGAGDLTQQMGDVAEVNARGQETRRLLAEGMTGNGTIISADDTGRRLAGNALVAIKAAVTPDGGEAYTAEWETLIAGTDMTGYSPGVSGPVRIDPANRQNVTFGS